MAEESRVITRQEGPSIIHERTDSKGILADLFKNVQNPRPDKTFRERNLPESFFKPPGESSSKEFPVAGHGSGVLHVRSRSAPTSYNQQTLSLAPEIQLSTTSTYPTLTPSGQQQHQQQTQTPASSAAHHHPRQKSVPNPQAPTYQQHPLFSSAIINQQYKVGCLQDGRIVFLNRVTNDMYPDSPVTRDQILGPLNPEHWTAHVDRGEVYYVDHSTRSTTWFDPRFPKEIQEPFIHNRHQHNQALQGQQQQSTANSRSLSPQHRQVSTAPVSSVVQTPQGMNMMPHQPAQQQHHQANYATSQIYGTGAIRNTTGAPALPQSHPPVIRQTPPVQQKTGVYELELQREREHMRLRQKEIQQQLLNQHSTFHEHSSQMSQPPGMQEQMMRRQLGEDYLMNSPVSPLANLRNTDPFLYHGRQESGDSGFSVSTPHTPENFLAHNMEELSLYTNPNVEPWQQSSSAMDVTGGGNSMMPQEDQIMSDGQDDLSDIYLNDLESVLQNDKNNPYGNPITWL